jgi:hypothetical protein
LALHDAEYFRQRRQLQRIARGLEPTRDFVHAERFVQAGWELRLMMAAPLQQQRLKHDEYCICGKPHHQNFPWTVRSDHGFGFNVYYFCSNPCKSRSVREHQ